MKCFIIGNGESRKDFDLTKVILTPKVIYPVYGCNALYRDFIPDLLFISDKRMVEEVKGKDLNLAVVDNNLVRLNTGAILCLPNSFKVTGIAAVTCAPILNPKIEDFYLLGFDMYPSDDTGKLNNLYKDSPNYRKSDECYIQMASHSVPSLKFVFDFYKNKNFILVNKKPSEYFKGIKNVTQISYNEFDIILKDCHNG